jgi:ribosomal protein S6 kinase alpha-5
MSEHEVCGLFRGIVSSVYYLHSLRIVHRDLKPENLVFINSSQTSELKLIDFGFARELPELESGQSMRSPCTTLDYCAPEVLDQIMAANTSKTSNSVDRISTTSSESSFITSQRGALAASGYDESCDLWSMGVILYTLLTGRLLSRDLRAARQLNDFHSFIVNLNGPEWDMRSQAVKDILRGLLEPNPSRRLTIEQLSQNDWIMNSIPKGVKRNKTITMTLRKRRAPNIVKSDEPPLVNISFVWSVVAEKAMTY